MVIVVAVFADVADVAGVAEVAGAADVVDVVDVSAATVVATKPANGNRKSNIMTEVCYGEYDSREGACIATTWLRD